MEVAFFFGGNSIVWGDNTIILGGNSIAPGGNSIVLGGNSIALTYFGSKTPAHPLALGLLVPLMRRVCQSQEKNWFNFGISLVLPPGLSLVHEKPRSPVKSSSRVLGTTKPLFFPSPCCVLMKQ